MPDEAELRAKARAAVQQKRLPASARRLLPVIQGGDGTPPLQLPDLSGLTLLVVDDDDDSLYITAHFLEACGATVLQAPNGMTALAFLDTHRPDAVITDLSMPGIDGVELLRHIRSRISRLLPVIALTAFPDFYIRNRQYRFDAFLRKPVDIEILAKTIRKVLDGLAQ